MSTTPLAQRLGAWLPPLALALLVLLGCNRGLWTPDEPREAEISREMALSPGIIPTLNGERFIEKPPLYYWTVAAVFRLTGGPSVLGARAVSVAAAAATLAILVIWGSAAHSRAAGWLAALMLASSVQFLVSSHWVLIDPLLMMTTTLAAWAGWELLARRDSWLLRLQLYGALILALWIKGLIGPVLIGAGLLAFVAVDRPTHWRRLRPIACLSVLLLAVLLLALAIWKQGGNDALWEWAYVNHVQRLINPAGSSGHRQPLLYYTWTLPFALLPWLLPLVEALRPAHWRRVRLVNLTELADPARFGAIMSGAMLLVLSASATKRETYLLPLLPLIFLWLGIRTHEWWQQWQLRGDASAGAGWWLQAVLLAIYALAVPIGAWIWLRSFNPWVVVTLLAALLCVAALFYYSVTVQRLRAGPAAMSCAVAGAVIVLLLAPLLLNHMKDMAPFVRTIDRSLPADQPVYALGIDETLRAEFPFYTGRTVVPIKPAQRPEWIVQQDNHDNRAVDLAPDYVLTNRQSFGSHRTLELWRLAAAGANPP
ncbi:MAG TPA: phospholipid carrier-dependent glycosyltransferase [Steroidobacteraceae bacterium]|jgi:4-amino-4-deoxy-L-arabinose transferase-like glycosyltransferase